MMDSEVEKLQKLIESPDFVPQIAQNRYKCVGCGAEISKGTEAFFIPIQGRWCCKSCQNGIQSIDIINKNTMLRDRKMRALKEDTKPKPAVAKVEKKQEVKKNDVSEVRQQILNKCRELFSPYKKYSTKIVNGEIDRMLADGKTEPGILYTLNWWYDQPGSNPELAGGKLSIIDIVYDRAMKNMRTKRRAYQSLRSAEDPETISVAIKNNVRKQQTGLFRLD